METVDRRLNNVDRILPSGYGCETQPPILKLGNGWALHVQGNSISSSPSKRRKVESKRYSSLLYRNLNCEEYCGENGMTFVTRNQPNTSNTTFGKLISPNKGKNRAIAIREINSFVLPPKRIAPSK